MPRWSPDGNTLYFRSTRDSHPCIYAQRLDRNTKTPVGEVIDIAHSHAVRHAWPTYFDTGAIGLALARDRLVYSRADYTGNFWLTRINLDNFR